MCFVNYARLWDQLVLNHANSKNIVFQRISGFLIHPVGSEICYPLGVIFNLTKGIYNTMITMSVER
jgi:hypothetical protein